MDKPQIIGLGLDGLVGSRIEEVLSERFEFISLSKEAGIDITKPETLTQIKDYKDANFVIHLAAKADVEGCEKDKDYGESGDAWRINVGGSRNVAELCRETGKKIIYISTDFVFDGTIREGELYTEEDIPNPLNWYAKTKYEGERAIEDSGVDYCIARISYPYRAKFELKKDFLRAIHDRLVEGLVIKAVTDHVFCPTFIDNIALSIEALIKNDSTGIFHVVGDQATSPYDAAIMIAKTFDLDENLISKILRAEFFKDKALRPFNLALSNDKIKKLGVEMLGFEEGLLAVKSQLQ